MLANSMNILALKDGSMKIELTFVDSTAGNHLAILSTTADSFDVEIKKHRKKRSLSANSYLWTICDKIAKVIKSTREEVYKQAIRQAGKMTFIAVPDEAVEDFLRLYNAEGLGNYAEATEKAKKPDYTVIAVFHGSSGYSTSEMARLVDYVVEDAKELGIETMTPEEINALIERVGK